MKRVEELRQFKVLDEKPKRDFRKACAGPCGRQKVYLVRGGLCVKCLREKEIAEGTWEPRRQQKSWPGYALEAEKRALLLAWGRDVRRVREVYKRLTFGG